MRWFTVENINRKHATFIYLNSNDILTTNFSQLLSLPDVVVRDFNFFFQKSHVTVLSERKRDWWFEAVTEVKCRAITLFARKTPLTLQLSRFHFISL